jgi:hypothetical protein
MKQKLCIVLGIAMLAYVGAVVSGVIGTGDSSFVAVSTGEADMVLGGGQAGASFSNGTCGGGTLGCNADGYVSKPGGSYWNIKVKTCGGSCGNITLEYGPAPE